MVPPPHTHSLTRLKTVYKSKMRRSSAKMTKMRMMMMMTNDKCDHNENDAKICNKSIRVCLVF